MFLASLLECWRRGSHAPAHKQMIHRLAVEALEERCVLDGSFGPWGAPVNLGSVVNTAFLDQRGTISKDGLSLYFGSNRPGSVGTVEGSDLYVSQRATVNDPWGTPQRVEALSSVGDDNAPTFSPDGHWVYFGSDRAGGCGLSDIWAAHRQNANDDFGWETPVNLGCTINSPLNEDGPTYFEDESGAVTLYFTSFQRPGGLGDWDIYASYASADDHVSFSAATHVPELSSPRRDTRTSIRRDGLEMFITSNRAGSVPDGTGAPSLDIWVATRASTNDPWSTPVNLGAPINTGAADGAPSLSFDGLTLYFDSTRAGGFGSRDLQVATRVKIHEGDEGPSFTRVRGVPLQAQSGLDFFREAVRPEDGSFEPVPVAGVTTDEPLLTSPEEPGRLPLAEPAGSVRAANATQSHEPTAAIDAVFADPDHGALADTLGNDLDLAWII